MSNKKFLKRDKDRNIGTYVCTPMRILNDKNLTSNAKVLMMAIFSDSDDFIFNQNLYANRLGISRGLVSKAIANLVEHGYATETVKKGNGYGAGFTYSYTFSQFGDLKETSSTDEQEEIEPVQPQEEIEPVQDDDDAITFGTGSVESVLDDDDDKPIDLNFILENDDDDFYQAKRQPLEFFNVRDRMNGEHYKIDNRFKEMWDKWSDSHKNGLLNNTSQTLLNMKLIENYRQKHKAY